MTALAVEAFAPSMESFNCGRAFSAGLGLVPRQFSSSGKERLGRTSKAGQADIRRLLNWMGRKSIPEDSWLARITLRKPRMPVAIALANKMARTMWALLTKMRIIEFRHRQEQHSIMLLLPVPDKRQREKARTQMGKTIEQIWIRKTSSGLRAPQLANEIWI